MDESHSDDVVYVSSHMHERLYAPDTYAVWLETLHRAPFGTRVSVFLVYHAGLGDAHLGSSV